MCLCGEETDGNFEDKDVAKHITHDEIQRESKRRGGWCFSSA